MNTFEIGKEYSTRSICDYDCIFTIKITGRTAKTVTYEYMGETRRSKIRVDEFGEFIRPDRYSMAPIFHAKETSAPESLSAAKETVPPVSSQTASATPSNVVMISQPADTGSLIVAIGQRVECVCGACYPIKSGMVVGFIDLPFGGVHALIRWDDRPGVLDRVRPADIHRRGWRSSNGSPLGVFIAG